VYRKLFILASSAALAACSTVGGDGFNNGTFTLVQAARPVSVGTDQVVVTAPRPWNKISARLFVDVPQVEDWTLNGPYLDGITFVTGLKSGAYIVRQDKREYRQVPKYRSDMTAPEIASMLESFYRVRAGTIDFKTTGLIPRTFMGYPGFQFDFDHLDSDEVWRRGRTVGAVIDGRLYLILLDGTRMHYFSAAAADFEAVANSARIKRGRTDSRQGRAGAGARADQAAAGPVPRAGACWP